MYNDRKNKNQKKKERKKKLDHGKELLTEALSPTNHKSCFEIMVETLFKKKIHLKKILTFNFRTECFPSDENRERKFCKAEKDI